MHADFRHGKAPVITGYGRRVRLGSIHLRSINLGGILDRSHVREIRCFPVNPVAIVVNLETLAVRGLHVNVGIGVLVAEELVHERRHRLGLATGRLAMLVTAGKVEADAVLDSHGLPHFGRRHHGLVARLVAQPFVTGVAERDHRARGNHGDEFVVVVRELVRVLTLQALHEPAVVRVVNLLDVRTAAREVRGSAPRVDAAATRFLGDGERHAFVEGTRKERHLARIGAARNRNLAHIEVVLVGNLRKAVNQAAHAPRPCRIVTVLVLVAVELVEAHVRVLLAVHGIFRHLVVAERHLYKAAEDARRERTRTAVHADDNRVRAVAGGNAELRRDRHRLATFLDSDREGAATVGCAHVRRNRLVANLVFFDIRLDFVTALAPVIELGDLGTVVEFERIGKFLVGLEFASSGAEVFAPILNIEVKRNLCRYRNAQPHGKGSINDSFHSYSFTKHPEPNPS